MEYQTLADIRAKEAEARRIQGNALANMTPGRGIVSSMSQLGGMLGGQVMDAFGQYSPEQQKAMSLDKILGSRQGPPKTQEEADALVNELAQAGHAQEARQAMLNWQNDQQTRFKTDKMEMENRALLQLPQLEAEWNYGTAGKQFKQGYAKKWLGLKDKDLVNINSEEDIIAAIEKFSGGLDTSDGRAKYTKKMKQYEAAKKTAKDAFLGKKYRKDALGKKSEGLDLTAPATEKSVEEKFPDAAATRHKVLGNTATYDDKVLAQTAGFADTPGVTQVNPDDAGFWREKQEYHAKQDIMRQVSAARVKAAPVAFFGDLTLSPAESKQDKINREIEAWTDMALEPGGYFYMNPDKVQAYVADVHGFYKNLPPKDKLKAKKAAKKAEKEAKKEE